MKILLASLLLATFATAQQTDHGFGPRTACDPKCEMSADQWNTGGPGTSGISFSGGDGSCTPHPGCAALTDCDNRFTVTYDNPHSYSVNFWIEWDDGSTSSGDVAVGKDKSWTSPGDGTNKTPCGSNTGAKIILIGNGGVSMIDVECDDCDAPSPQPSQRWPAPPMHVETQLAAQIPAAPVAGLLSRDAQQFLSTGSFTTPGELVNVCDPDCKLELKEFSSTGGGLNATAALTPVPGADGDCDEGDKCKQIKQCSNNYFIHVQNNDTIIIDVCLVRADGSKHTRTLNPGQGHNVWDTGNNKKFDCGSESIGQLWLTSAEIVVVIDVNCQGCDEAATVRRVRRPRPLEAYSHVTVARENPSTLLTADGLPRLP